MRVSLTTKYRRHEHWWIGSYIVPHITAGYSAKLRVETLRQPAIRGEHEYWIPPLSYSRICAAATDAGFVLNDDGDVCGLPYEFKSETCKFWVDLSAVGYRDKCVSGMYPHEWARIKQEATVTLDTILQASLRETIKIADIEVPLFWYPPAYAYKQTTLLEYMRRHNLPTGV